MDIKDLNKTQLVMLTILLSFITSIATGIITTAVMNDAPVSVTEPVNRVIRETVEKIVTVPSDTESNEMTKEQEQLLEDLKYIKPLTVSLFKKEGSDNKLLGNGFLLGENKVVISKVIKEPKEGEIYFIKSVFGEKNISKIIVQEDFTIIDLAIDKEENINTENTGNNNTDNTTNTENTENNTDIAPISN